VPSISIEPKIFLAELSKLVHPAGRLPRLGRSPCRSGRSVIGLLLGRMAILEGKLGGAAVAAIVYCFV
jgi:hypothetical protein